MKNRFLLAVLPFLGYLIVVLLKLSMRIKYLGLETVRKFVNDNQNFIIAFWHGRQLFMPFTYHGKKIHILISEHGDGEIVSRAMRYFGFGSVRGSTTHGAFKAFRELIKLSRESDIAITPDGPQGPRYRVQMGVIELARLTGLPILPVTFSASSRSTLKSWDHFIIPHPFSKGVFIWGSPIYVERETAGESLEAKRRLLEESLTEITERADHFFSPVQDSESRPRTESREGIGSPDRSTK